VSDYRAIAAVTATLQNLLTEAIKEAVPGASVMIGPPRDYSSHEVAEGRVNIFLYKVFPNMTWRNEELPFRRPDGTLIRGGGKYLCVWQRQADGSWKAVHDMWNTDS